MANNGKTCRFLCIRTAGCDLFVFYDSNCYFGTASNGTNPPPGYTLDVGESSVNVYTVASTPERGGFT